MSLALTACSAGSGAGVRSEQRAIARSVDLVATRQSAESTYAQGRYEESVRHYHTLLEAIPDNADLWYRLANAHARLGNARQAGMAYEQSVARDPSNARAWHNLGLMQHRQSMDAFGRAVARTQGGDASVEQESLRVLRILQDADARIRQAPALEEPAGSTADMTTAPEEAGNDETPSR
ncbi:MAG: tetratricopeptide repeat protein [Luteimonas sp.]